MGILCSIYFNKNWKSLHRQSRWQGGRFYWWMLRSFLFSSTAWVHGQHRRKSKYEARQNVDARGPQFRSVHRLLNSLHGKSSSGIFILGCQAPVRAETWQDFMVILATEQLFTYRPSGLHQSPLCFSVVLALVPGALSLMSKRFFSVKAARNETKHPTLVVWGTQYIA